MRCDVLTLFPKVIEAILSESILKRAVEKGFLEVKVYNIRDFTEDRHHVVDDSPYGGGAGMVLKPEPIFRVMETLKKDGEERLVILLSPQGKPFNQSFAEKLSEEKRRISFICGRYEGIDERVRTIVDDELSLGDYVLSGGELAAMAVVEASARLIPGVLGDDKSAVEDSFSEGILDFPHYTRPAEFRGMKVPEVLLSGNHEEIRIWRRKESLSKTLNKRPDLIEKANLSEEDRRLLKEIVDEK